MLHPLAVYQGGRWLLSHTLGQPVKTNLTQVLFMRKVVLRTFTHIHNETGMVTRNRKNEKVVIIWAHKPAWSSAPRISVMTKNRNMVMDYGISFCLISPTISWPVSVDCSCVVYALLKVWGCCMLLRKLTNAAEQCRALPVNLTHTDARGRNFSVLFLAIFDVKFLMRQANRGNDKFNWTRFGFPGFQPILFCQRGHFYLH